MPIGKKIMFSLLLILVSAICFYIDESTGRADLIQILFVTSSLLLLGVWALSPVSSPKDSKHN